MCKVKRGRRNPSSSSCFPSHLCHPTHREKALIGRMGGTESIKSFLTSQVSWLNLAFYQFVPSVSYSIHCVVLTHNWSSFLLAPVAAAPICNTYFPFCGMFINILWVPKQPVGKACKRKIKHVFQRQMCNKYKISLSLCLSSFMLQLPSLFANSM